MRILLDTNAYSDWRRHGRWEAVICTAGQVLVPVVVLGELRHGFLLSANGRENEGKLVRFLSERAVAALDVTGETSKVYAALKRYLRMQGTPIPENDIWIAALAVEHQGSLVTCDAHFEHLPQVARVIE